MALAVDVGGDRFEQDGVMDRIKARKKYMRYEYSSNRTKTYTSFNLKPNVQSVMALFESYIAILIQNNRAIAQPIWPLACNNDEFSTHLAD